MVQSPTGIWEQMKSKIPLHGDCTFILPWQRELAVEKILQWAKCNWQDRFLLLSGPELTTGGKKGWLAYLPSDKVLNPTEQEGKTLKLESEIRNVIMSLAFSMLHDNSSTLGQSCVSSYQLGPQTEPRYCWLCPIHFQWKLSSCFLLLDLQIFVFSTQLAKLIWDKIFPNYFWWFGMSP